jgi:hypothetical protein
MTRSGSPSMHAILEELPSEGDSASSEGESFGSPLLRACNTMIPATPIATTPLPEETPTFQIASIGPQWTNTSTTLLEQLAAHPEGR